ncbi:MAG: hypothetical protein KDD62_05320, partial [Bdellovibrionales bacterium]|nr:hypothetical protein [Bdellovibrionales bacterium]
YVTHLEHDWEYGDLPDAQALTHYKNLVTATGIAPFGPAEFREVCQKILGLKSSAHQRKIDLLTSQLEVSLDQSFIEQYMLANTNFVETTAFSLPDEVLRKHLLRRENQTGSEYTRVLRVFRCSKLYQDDLEQLRKEAQSADVLRRSALLMSAMVRTARSYGGPFGYQAIPIEPGVEERLSELICHMLEDKTTKLGSTLLDAYWALNNRNVVLEKATSIMNDFIADKGTSKPYPGVFAAARIMGSGGDEEKLRPQWFAACLEPSIDIRFRKAYLSFLSDRHFSEPIAAIVQSVVDPKSSLCLEDLRFILAYEKISSAYLRHIVESVTPAMMVGVQDLGLSPSALLRELYPHLRLEGFALMYHASAGIPHLMTTFNELCRNLRSTHNVQRLEYGLARLYDLPESVRIKFLNYLAACNGVVREEQFELLNDCLRGFSAIYIAENNVFDSNASGGQSLEEVINSKIETVLGSHTIDLGAMLTAINEWLAQNSRELLPGAAITSESIMAIAKSWDSLEPIFTFASKHRALSLNPHRAMATGWGSEAHKKVLRHFAELVSNFSPARENGWKEYRYNLERPSVKLQIGQLSEEQLAIWTAEHYIELGDLVQLQGGSDRGGLIASQLALAISHGHFDSVLSCEDGKRIKELAHKLHQSDGASRLSLAQSLLDECIEKRSLAEVKVRLPHAQKAQRALTMLQQKDTLAINTKLKGQIAAVAQYLDPEHHGTIRGLLKRASDSELSSVERSALFTETQLVDLEKAIEVDIQKAEEHQINPEQVAGKFTKAVYVEYERITALTELCRFFVLEEEDIRAGVQVREESVVDLLGSLAIVRRYMEGAPEVEPYLRAIQDQIKVEFEGFQGKRMAIIVSDDPEILTQVGKYPLGNSSCQNYEGHEKFNISLPSIVGDAHQRAAFLIDINRLPEDVKAEINTYGFNVVGPSVKARDLLGASFARELIKLTETGSLYLEPTYSKLGVNDLGTVRVFNTFVGVAFAEPMDVSLLRIGKELTVKVAASANPVGQYEDGSVVERNGQGGIVQSRYTLNARVVQADSKESAADRTLADTIRSETQSTRFTQSL